MWWRRRRAAAAKAKAEAEFQAVTKKIGVETVPNGKRKEYEEPEDQEEKGAESFLQENPQSATWVQMSSSNPQSSE